MARTVSFKGRPQNGDRILSVTELVREDLAILKEGQRGINKPKAIRESHHKLARLIAQGVRGQELYELSGYSYSRVHTMQQDPSFLNLIASYRDLTNDEFREETKGFVSLAHGNMVRAERMLSDKLDKMEDEDELPTIRDLALIVSDRADRLGHGKKSTVRNEHVDFAKMLDAANARSDRARPVIIDHVPQAPAAQARVEVQVPTPRAPQATARASLPAPRSIQATKVPPLSSREQLPLSQAMPPKQTSDSEGLIRRRI